MYQVEREAKHKKEREMRITRIDELGKKHTSPNLTVELAKNRLRVMKKWFPNSTFTFTDAPNSEDAFKTEATNEQVAAYQSIQREQFSQSSYCPLCGADLTIRNCHSGCESRED